MASLSREAGINVVVATGCMNALGTRGPEQAQIFLEERVELKRVVIGHPDLNGNPAYHEGILRRGGNVGFDTIGKQRVDYTRSDTAGYHRSEFEKEQ